MGENSYMKNGSDLNSEVKFLANPEFISREIAGEYVLVPVGKAAELFGGLASLNETGVFLWNLLAEKKSCKELSVFLAEEYELNEEESIADVSDFLDSGIKRNIILKCCE